MRSNVIDLIKKISRQRGRRAETTISTALNEMMGNGEIVSFYKTTRREDKFLGIDFFVIKLSGEKIPLQVKSSFTGASKHRREFPNVPAVIVGVENIETVKNKIRGVLK